MAYSGKYVRFLPLIEQMLGRGRSDGVIARRIQEILGHTWRQGPNDRDIAYIRRREGLERAPQSRPMKFETRVIASFEFTPETNYLEMQRGKEIS